MSRVPLLNVVFLLAIVAPAPAWAETFAAELTGSHVLADVVLVPSSRYDAPLAYLGPCPGRRGERIRVRIGDNRYEKDSLEVQFTDRHRANLLFCTRR